MYEEHDGFVLEKLLDDLGIKKQVLADKLNRNPNTITRWCKSSYIKNEILIQIGRVLRYDITARFPRLIESDGISLRYFNSDPEAVLNKIDQFEKEHKQAGQVVADYKLQLDYMREQIAALREIIDAKNGVIDVLQQTLRELREVIQSK